MYLCRQTIAFIQHNAHFWTQLAVATVSNAALSEALDVLGQPSKRALLYQLKEGYGISADFDSSISIKRLQSALTEILGATGALLVMKIVFAKVDTRI